MKRNILILIALLCSFCLSSSCTEKESEQAIVVQLNIPDNVTIANGDDELTLRVMFAQPPLKSDLIVLTAPSGKVSPCKILDVSDKSVTFELPEGMVSGEYVLSIRRAAKEKRLGSFNVVIQYNSDVNTDIKPEGDNNVYGVVSCGDKGIPDVVVSDGVQIVRTDENGVYQFESEKEYGYVFVSLPSGYEAMTEGVMPKIHHQLTKSKAVPERLDFPLVKADNQDNHTMLFFGDMHLAARTSDARQFADFTADVNEFIASSSSENVYAMTLGDMTWELYWVSNKYAFDEYIRDINALNGITVFNTIGNHDHDMAFAGDFDTVTKYRKTVAPTYYSFNIGKVHYVVLDNILCKNTGKNTSSSRDYDDSITDVQLEWLKKDLSYVSTSTPVVITMHAPVYTDSNGASLNNTSDFEKLLEKFEQVHVWTGHTHKMYNVDKLSSKHIFEHNAGAVCATWWWTGHFTDGVHIAQDGAPGGYSVMDVAGSSFKWRFKATDADDNHQFRTYDRNQIVMTADKFLSGSKKTAENIKAFEEAAVDWLTPDDDNYVYINVWNYDPEWKIEVKEGTQSLTVEQVKVKDPLHLIAYNANSPTGDFCTTPTRHMFRVKAKSASSTLEIKVTDRFGRVYTETMNRPKKFSVDMYKF